MMNIYRITINETPFLEEAGSLRVATNRALESWEYTMHRLAGLKVQDLTHAEIRADFLNKVKKGKKL